MNCTRETVLIRDETVIHTRYTGDVTCDFILAAISEWLALLHDKQGITHLIFDYTDANMSALTVNDAETIAAATAALVKQNPNLKMVGVVPKASDFQITSLWAGYAATRGGPVDFMNIIIVESLREVFAML